MKKTYPSNVGPLITEAGAVITRMTNVSELGARCQRAEAGPLTFAAIIWNDSDADVSRDATHTTHIDIVDKCRIGRIPVVANSPSQWILRSLAGVLSIPARLDIPALDDLITQTRLCRESFLEGEGDDLQPPSPEAMSIDLQISLLARPLSIGLLQNHTTVVRKKACRELGIPESRSQRDKITIRRMEEAACAACGYGAEDQ